MNVSTSVRGDVRVGKYHAADASPEEDGGVRAREDEHIAMLSRVHCFGGTRRRCSRTLPPNLLASRGPCWEGHTAGARGRFIFSVHPHAVWYSVLRVPARSAPVD